MRAARSRSSRFACLAAITTLLATAQASALEFPDLGLEWEGTRAQDVTAKFVDLTIVRPVASARVAVGGLLFIPAALLSAPMGREGFEGALDVLIVAPAEYAFDREIGDL